MTSTFICIIAATLLGAVACSSDQEVCDPKTDNCGASKHAAYSYQGLSASPATCA
jgi:hypothetical protein